MKLAKATELWLLERTRKLPNVVSVGSSSTGGQRDVVGPSVEELVPQQQRRSRRTVKYILAVLQAPWSPTKLPYSGS